MSADRRNILVIVILGLILGGMYFLAIDSQAPQFTFTQQHNAFNGIAGSPYRYRVLVPAILEGGIRIFAFVGSPQQAFQVASLTYECLGLIFQLGMLYALLRQFFQPIGAGRRDVYSRHERADAGVFHVSAVVHSAGGLFRARICAGVPWPWGWLTLVVVLASLNRETGVFLPLAVFLSSLNDFRAFGTQWLQRAAQRRDVYLSFGLVVLSTAIFLGLRLVRGGAEPVDALPDVIRRNLERNNLIAATMGIPLLLGFGWIFAVMGLRSAPCFLRRIARVVPFYLVAFAIWGWWREVRILTSLYPVLVPLVLVYCCDPPLTPLIEPLPEVEGA